MKEDKTIITLGFFAFMAIIGIGLLYLLKKEPEPVVATTVQTPQPPQIVYIPQPNSQRVVATEEVRPTTSHIINHNLHNANQWYEIKFPRDAITWQIRARGKYDLLYSHSPAHQTYFTLTSQNVLTSDTSPDADINAIFIMCETSEAVVELEIWRNG